MSLAKYVEQLYTGAIIPDPKDASSGYITFAVEGLQRGLELASEAPVLADQAACDATLKWLDENLETLMDCYRKLGAITPRRLGASANQTTMQNTIRAWRKHSDQISGFFSDTELGRRVLGVFAHYRDAFKSMQFGYDSEQVKLLDAHLKRFETLAMYLHIVTLADRTNQLAQIRERLSVIRSALTQTTNAQANALIKRVDNLTKMLTTRRGWLLRGRGYREGNETIWTLYQDAAVYQALHQAILDAETQTVGKLGISPAHMNHYSVEIAKAVLKASRTV